MGLILDSSLLVADEREDFNLPAWLRGRPPEPVAVSAITFSELWFGIEAEENAADTGPWPRSTPANSGMFPAWRSLSLDQAVTMRLIGT